MKQYPGARRSTVPLPVQILLTLLLAAVVVIGGFIAWLALIMLGVKQFSQLLAGLGLLIVAGFLVTRIWGLGRLRTVSLVCGVLLGAVLLTGTGYGLYNRYIDGIPTVGSEVDLLHVCACACSCIHITSIATHGGQRTSSGSSVTLYFTF